MIPDDGGIIWTDNALIPKGGDAFTASTLLNFVYDPEVAGKLYGAIHYIRPVKGSKRSPREDGSEDGRQRARLPD